MSLQQRWEIDYSDRTQMMDMAVGLVHAFSAREAFASMSSEEETAYKAALRYLTAQYEAGHTETVRRTTEVAVSDEFSSEDLGEIDDEPNERAD